MGELRLHPAARTATWNDQQVQLSGREFKVLYALATRYGRAFSSTELLGTVWTDKPDPRTNSVQFSVCRLRRKLHAIGAPHLVHTRHGHGYQLHVPD